MFSKQFLYAVLLIFFSSIFGLFLLESGLRFTNIGYGNSPLESDSIFHHVHPKSYNFLSYNPNGEYGGHQVFYDQYGLVADPDGEAAKKTNCRIAFLGDSFTEASQVEYKMSFVGRVESSTNCTVRNYGVSSYSPIFYILQWKHSVSLWQPDLVIVQLFHNDIWGDENYLDQAKLDADGNPVAIPGPSNDWLVKQLRKSFVLRLLRRSQLTLGWMLANSGDEINVVGGFVEENPDISEFSAELMKMIKEGITDTGAEFAFFVIPSKLRLYDRDRDYGGLEFADKWKAWANDNGIKFIDLVPPFRNQVLIGDRPFFERDIHFNENGHAIAAKSILRFIEQQSKQKVVPTMRR